MLETAERHPELTAQVVPSPRTLAVDPVVRRLLADGVLGDILVADIAMGKSAFVDPDAPLHWRHDPVRSGHNIMDLGIAYESVMRWIGFARSVIASGTVNVAVRRDPAAGLDVPIEIPDHLDVLAALEHGGQARFQVSAVTGLAPPPAIWLFGTEGTLRLDIDGKALAIGRRGEDRLRPLTVSPSEAGRWRVEEEFIAAIRGDDRVRLTTFADGVRYMEFVDAVHRSLETGRREAVGGW